MPKVLSPKTADGQYNVRAFGATGDGSTDDTAALNACLQKVYDDGGGTVIVPPGTYKTSAPLIVRSNTTIECDNNVQFNRTASGALVMNGAYDEDQSVYTGHGNIHIRGGIWNMNGPTVTNANLGFAIAHGQNITFTGCTIKDVPGNHAIEINSSKTVRIRDCRFLGYYDTVGGGTVDYNEAIQIDLALTGGGTFGAFGLYDDTPCDDVIVQGCYFGASGTASTTAWYRGVGSHSGKAGFEHTNVRISDNHFDGLLGIAIGLYGFRRTVVADNVFDSCGAMIYANSATDQDFGNISITGNVAKDCTGALPAITIGPTTGDATGIVVSGNTIDGTTGSSGHGIDMSRSTYVNVTGNTIANVGGAGIRFVGTCNDVAVTNNIISGTGDAGIQVTNSLNCVVNMNTLRDLGANGIYSTGSTDVSYDGNVIKGAGRNTNATYYGIRLSSSCIGYRISNNRVRLYGSGNEVLNAISVTSTCTGGYFRDNDTSDIENDEGGTSRAATDAFSVTHSIDTSETRSGASSATFDDLATVGPTVTLQTGSKVLVIITGALSSGTAGVWSIMGVAVSGATTTAATDTNALAYRQSTLTNSINSTYQGSWVGELTVTPGVNTFTCKYRSAANSQTTTYLRRKITVIPLN